MWLERSIGACQEKVDLTEMSGGMTIFQRVYLQMTITNLYGTSVRTDHETMARRPDLVITDNTVKSCQTIDVTIPEDGRVREKEDEKVEKHQDLAREFQNICGVKTGYSSGSGSNTTEI